MTEEISAPLERFAIRLAFEIDGIGQDEWFSMDDTEKDWYRNIIRGLAVEAEFIADLIRFNEEVE